MDALRVEYLHLFPVNFIEFTDNVFETILERNIPEDKRKEFVERCIGTMEEVYRE